MGYDYGCGSSFLLLLLLLLLLEFICAASRETPQIFPWKTMEFLKPLETGGNFY